MPAGLQRRREARNTPIEHLIVVVGENISFDNLFAHLPRRRRAPPCTICCRKGSSTATAAPDRISRKAAQRRAEVRETYQVTPRIVGTYGELPRPGTTYAVGLPRLCSRRALSGGVAERAVSDHQARRLRRRRSATRCTASSRCGSKSMAAGATSSSGSPKPRARARGTAPIRSRAPIRARSPWGSTIWPPATRAYFRELADNYALSDNHHQPVMGGTGANFQALATGHAIAYWKDGALAEPPPKQIENPDPRPGTNNWYTQSGYSSGSYTKCADPDEPGAKSIRSYLAALPYPVFNDGNCEPGAYYLVNNYSAGFAATGEPAALGPGITRVPPQAQPTIAEALSAKGVSWKWYSGGRIPAPVSRGILRRLRSADLFQCGHDRPVKGNLQDHDALFRDIDDVYDACSRLCDPAQHRIRPSGIVDCRRVTRNSSAGWSRRYRPTRRYGQKPRSSSRSTRAAAIGTAAISRSSTPSATARASR